MFASATPRCTHLDEIRDVDPEHPGLRGVPADGRHLGTPARVPICGHVGCCDQSPNRHATRHFHATEHPLIQSFQPGEDWIWCYVDQVIMEPR